MKAATILAVLGVAIGFALGFVVGRGGKEAPSAEERGSEDKLIGRAARSGAGSESEASSAAAGAGGAATVAAGAPAKDADFTDKKDYVKSLAAIDPLKAIRWVQANSDDGSRDDLFQVIGTEWARRDPEAAFTWANGLPFRQDREDTLEGVMTGALEAGHEAAALAFVARLPPGEYQDTVMMAAVKHFAATDLDRAITLAGSMGETFKMRYAGRGIAEALIESGRIAEAQQRISELPYGTLRTQLALGLIERLGDKDIDAVVAWIAQRPTGPDGGEIFDTAAMRNVTYSLSRDLVEHSGPAEALAWANNLSDKNLRNQYLERVGEVWASRSPQEASEWLINALNEQGFDNLKQVSEGILEEWIEVDQSAPFEQINRITDPETRLKAAFMALNEIARENPRIAAERLADWSEVDPVEASQVTARIVSSWLRRDPEQASTWLNEQPRGVIKDRGVEQLVHSLLSEDKDTEAARAWIGEVQDEKMHDRLIQQVESVEGKAQGKKPQVLIRTDPFGAQVQ